MSQKFPWWLVGAGALIAIAASQKDTIMLFGQRIVDAAHETIFKALLPDYADAYGDVMLRVAREQSTDPFLVFALGDRESRWGDALDENLKGDSGHGHGLMQIDDRSWGLWLASHLWTDPYTNVTKGVLILKGKLSFFTGRSVVLGYTDGTTVTIDKSAAKLGVSPGKYPDPRPLSGDALWKAAIAAYNTGEGNVLMAIAAGKSPDTTTAGGDYSGDVLSRANDLAAQYGQEVV